VVSESTLGRTNLRLRLAAFGAAGLLLGGLMVPASALAAGSGSLKVSPVTSTTSTGATFTVDVVANANVPISGAQATLSFDKTRLQVTSITGAGPWAADGATLIGFPNSANMAAAVTQYNTSGKVGGSPRGALAAFFFANATSEPANTDVPLFTVVFQVTACGDSSLGLAIGPIDGSMIDGTIGSTYGYSIPVTSTSGSVVNPCPGQSPSPTAPSASSPSPSLSLSPAPTPSVGPSSSPLDGITHVSGTLDAGFLGLTVPASAAMPFVWNSTNRAFVLVQVSSNRSWSLSVRDATAGADQGHMTSGANRLATAMTAWVGSRGRVGLDTGGQLTFGGPTTTVDGGISGVDYVPVEFDQFVGGTDQPGTYGISVLFQAMSTF
jgi:hypothetical protein